MKKLETNKISKATFNNKVITLIFLMYLFTVYIFLSYAGKKCQDDPYVNKEPVKDSPNLEGTAICKGVYVGDPTNTSDNQEEDYCRETYHLKGYLNTDPVKIDAYGTDVLCKTLTLTEIPEKLASNKFLFVHDDGSTRLSIGYIDEHGGVDGMDNIPLSFINTENLLDIILLEKQPYPVGVGPCFNPFHIININPIPN